MATSVGCAGSTRFRYAPAPVVPRAEDPAPWKRGRLAAEDGTVPVAARGRALREHLEAGGLTLSTGNWVEAGPFNIGGRISSLAVDPNDTDRIWMGAADGGVWLSADGGATWAPTFDGQTATAIGSLVTHPTNSDIVYVGTGEEAGGGYSYDGEGVLKTTDGGASWTSLGLAEVRRIGKIAIDPVDPDRVFVAAGGGLHHRDEHRGVYRSTDGGQAWTRVLFVQDDAGAADVAIDPSDPTRVFAAIWQRNRGDGGSYFGGDASGLYRSEDGGDTWTELTTGLPSGTDVGRIGVAVAPSNPAVVYAIVNRASGSLDGIYRSVDSGDTWVRASGSTLPFFFSTFGYYFGQIRVDPANPNTVYALDIQMWRSTNGGTSFNAIGGSLHADQHALEIGPGSRLLVGNDGGFYSSADGASFTHNLTLPISQFYDLCVDPADPSRRFGGTQDNGTLRTVTAGTDDWTNVLGGDGMQCVVDPLDPDKVYAESQWGGIARSTNGGASFVGATSGIDGADRNNWVTPITHDPTQTGVLYTGTQRVYRSIDSAVSWNPISDDLSNVPAGAHGEHGGEHGEGGGHDHGQDPIQGTVTAIGVSELDNQVLWAGTDDGNVWVSTDTGALWSPVHPDPAFWVTEIAPDPHLREGAYVTVTGYRLDDTMPYLRYTDDLGTSWNDLTGNLPAVPLNSVAADPAWLGRVFVASDLGVHVTEDGGASWSFLGASLPVVVVHDLVLDAGSRTLFAGTHGRSMWTFDIDQLGIPDGDGDGVDNNADCALGDGGAFAAPTEVASLDVDRGPVGEAVLAWTDQSGSAGTGTTYDLARGTLDDLRVSGVSSAIGRACDVATPMFVDGDAVAPGTGVYYLVRGENVCGTGSWGADSDGVDRDATVCP